MNKRLKDNCCYTLDPLAKTLAKRAEIYDIRQANAQKRRPFCAGALSLDNCLINDNGHERENPLFSDNGKGAEAIRNCDEPPTTGHASWLQEFRRVFSSLNDVEKGIVLALAKDFRPQVAARMACTNRMRVYRTIEKLRKLLSTAHSLWLRRWE